MRSFLHLGGLLREDYHNCFLSLHPDVCFLYYLVDSFMGVLLQYS